MNGLNDIFNRNRQWSKVQKKDDPDYFMHMSAAQYPKILWFGCSDSRVSPVNMVDASPGEIFEFRNIANQIRNPDTGLQAVVHYAVDVLKIQQLVVCGHYGCGGMLAVINNQLSGPLPSWLESAVELRDKYRLYLEGFDTADRKANELSKINVLYQIKELSKNETILNAWENKIPVQIHALYFNLESGLIEELGIHASSTIEFEDSYKSAVQPFLK